VRPPKADDDRERYEKRDEADGALNEIDGVRRDNETQTELRETEPDDDVGERLEAADHILPSVSVIVHTIVPFGTRRKFPHDEALARRAPYASTCAFARSMKRSPWFAFRRRPRFAVVRTRDELSIVCRADTVPAEVAEVERGFRGLGVVGTLDFGITSVIAGLTAPLAAADIPIFNISTFDTDYILLREEHLEPAKAALGAAGYVLD
jgi:hypothetical protein